MRSSWICAAIVILVCSGCSRPQIENPTDAFAPAQQLTELRNKKLKEISGLAASRRNPGFYWVHNDSGNKPEVYLINTSLEIVLTCRIGDVDNRDWEDITVGPGPEEGKTYVYVGDIGDNDARYEYKYIYRFEEPLFEKGGESKIRIESFDTITFRLEDKRKDTETLLIDPRSKNLYVISKREEPVWLYEIKYPQSAGDTLVAGRIGSLPFTQIVGGDVRKDGKEIVLKNYEHVYYWRNDNYLPVAQLLKQSHYEVPYELEPQGEAISWSIDDSGFYTISEKNVGKSTYLYFYKYKSSGDESPGEAVSH